MITQKYLDELTYEIVGSAIEVHKIMGRGLLESVYHKCLIHELNIRAISFTSELLVPVNYKGLQIETELRCDLFIENCLVRKENGRHFWFLESGKELWKVQTQIS